MASAALGDELSCSICLSLYTEPVSLRCGHHFCRSCIGTALDTQEGSGVYSCPECREEYLERPRLERNRKLCNIIENFRPAQQLNTENTEISCTYCVETPAPAIRTCLQCEMSLCGKHLIAHNKMADHVLVEPTLSLSSKKCPIHKKLLEYYCPEDTTCLCVSCCLVGKHKGHQVELLDDAFENKKEKLRDVLNKLTLKREEFEARLQSLQQHREKVQKKADDVKKKVTAMFEDIRRQLEVQEKKVLSEISRQERQISQSVLEQIGKLETQKDKLSSKMSDIEELCNIPDPITVLQVQHSDPGDPDEEAPSVSDLDDFLISLTLHRSMYDIISNITSKCDFSIPLGADLLLHGETHSDYEELSKHIKLETDSETHLERPEMSHIEEPCNMVGPIAALQDQQSDSGDQDEEGPSGSNIGALLIPPTLYRSIDDFSIHVETDLLLDEKTASNYVELSEDLKTAMATKSRLERPDLPQRFTRHCQVMSVQSFSSGRHYWEVEVSLSGYWEVAMSYSSINPKRSNSSFGENNKSWSLRMVGDLYLVLHNKTKQSLQPDSPMQKLGVYLDYEAGCLSFYQLCGPVRHLHTFTATFTEPLHAAFYVDRGGWIKVENEAGHLYDVLGLLLET